MVYQDVETKAESKVRPIADRINALQASIATTREAIKVEDSKRREAELREEIKRLTREEREAHGELWRVQEDTFKDLLAEEYGLPRTHPKFEKAYYLAYEHGHSSGFSDIENYFIGLVPLVK